MKFLNVLILSSLLSGCAVAPPAVLPEESKVVINPIIMESCGKLNDQIPKGITFEDTLIAHAEDVKVFVACKKLNDSKKKLIEEFLLHEKSKSTGKAPKS